jgi:hypothetical protein
MRPPLAAERQFTALQHCSLSSLWFAYNVQWNALIPIILPAQASAIAGQAHKEAGSPSGQRPNHGKVNFEQVLFLPVGCSHSGPELQCHFPPDLVYSTYIRGNR